MSRDAQQSLRRILEKYSINIRIIMCCESINSIIDPIKSRFLMLRSESYPSQTVQVF